MINYTFTKEDIELAEKFIDIRRRGYYADSKQLTDLYNRVLHKHVTPTNCSSCLSQRTRELEDALNHFKRTIELDSKPVDESKQDEPITIKEDENKAVRNKKKK